MFSSSTAQTQLAIDPSAAQRAKTFKRLARRNNFVALLRWVIPGLGLIVFGILVAQIILTNIAKDIGISGLRVEQDQVVVDQPRYGGITQNGTRYNIVAEVARIQTNATDIINLEVATITIEQSDGYKMVSNAPNARLDLSAQTIAAPATMRTTDSDGVVGTFSNALIDWTAQTFTADGPLSIEFEDGAIINAQSLIYDTAASSWDFEKPVYSLAGDGGF